MTAHLKIVCAQGLEPLHRFDWFPLAQIQPYWSFSRESHPKRRVRTHNQGCRRLLCPLFKEKQGIIIIKTIRIVNHNQQFHIAQLAFKTPNQFALHAHQFILKFSNGVFSSSFPCRQCYWKGKVFLKGGSVQRCSSKWDFKSWNQIRCEEILVGFRHGLPLARNNQPFVLNAN